MSELVLVLDFGGQYKELIARSIRSLSVYSEIRPGSISATEVAQLSPIGIVLTGGPNSAYLPNSPQIDPQIFDLGIPILGICYGMQLICHMQGGTVGPCDVSEYGSIRANLSTESPLFEGLSKRSTVLMSHTDQISVLPSGFIGTAHTDTCPFAAYESIEKSLYGVQFHPEVDESEEGLLVFRNFLFEICGASGDYRLDDFIESQIKEIRQAVGEREVLLALSGGVDSSVCASLLSQAIGNQLTCIFVDHGFMRHHEGDAIEEIFSNQDLNFIRVNAASRFLKKIEGVIDPEAKRKLIGEEFVRVFEETAKSLGDIPLLAQGTIYPDVIESGGELGAVIKSHHNVGGLPDNLTFTEVLEPLSGLFKDEVRIIGTKLGLPDSLVQRQPFPGPGLAIRIMGEVTSDKLNLLRLADYIMCSEIEKLDTRPQQYFAVHTGVNTVGVKGDERSYDSVIALRAVTTTDFMTVQYTPIPHEILGRIASRITNEIPQVSRIVYDITSKPPATVEWE